MRTGGAQSSVVMSWGPSPDTLVSSSQSVIPARLINAISDSLYSCPFVRLATYQQVSPFSTFSWRRWRETRGQRGVYLLLIGSVSAIAPKTTGPVHRALENNDGLRSVFVVCAYLFRLSNCKPILWVVSQKHLLEECGVWISLLSLHPPYPAALITSCHWHELAGM